MFITIDIFQIQNSLKILWKLWEKPSIRLDPIRGFYSQIAKLKNVFNYLRVAD